MVEKMISSTLCTITRPTSACRRSSSRAKMLDDREDISMSEIDLCINTTRTSNITPRRASPKSRRLFSPTSNTYCSEQCPKHLMPRSDTGSIPSTKPPHSTAARTKGIVLDFTAEYQNRLDGKYRLLTDRNSVRLLAACGNAGHRQRNSLDFVWLELRRGRLLYVS